jgi:hypothetical protein
LTPFFDFQFSISNFLLFLRHDFKKQNDMEAIANKSINWQVPSVVDSEISVEDYREMVRKSENSGYMSYETHRRKFNEWFNEISKERIHQNA